MIRLFLLGLKLAVFSFVVLLISQIPVGHQRICDHIHDFTMHHHVRGPVNWVGERFNFLEHHKISKADHTSDDGAAGSEPDKSDQERLSGLLKKRRGHSH